MCIKQVEKSKWNIDIILISVIEKTKNECSKKSKGNNIIKYIFKKIVGLKTLIRQVLKTYL